MDFYSILVTIILNYSINKTLETIGICFSMNDKYIDYNEYLKKK